MNKRTVQIRHRVASTRRLSVSGFFNLRVLIGLLVTLTGIFLALLGFGTFAAPAAGTTHAQQSKAATNSIDPLLPPGFDCSKIHELGIDKQENFRAQAIMIFCGDAQGGSLPASSKIEQLIKSLLPNLPGPSEYGAADVDLITGPDVLPHVTQSETFVAMNPDDPSQIVIAYNDSRCARPSSNYSGASVSTDGGTTFTRLTNADGCSPFASAGANFGDPVMLYNKPAGTWHAIWNDAACGGGGIGDYVSSTPWDVNSWTTHLCIHSNSNDSRQSGWVDNNLSSLFYGRMYVSYNDFNVGSGALFVRYSTDNGVTWTNARQITNTFIRNVQVTGDLVTGDVYIAAMDEGGGGLGNRINKFYRSTDGGNTWTNTYNGPPFPGPGRGVSGYFACMYNNPVYWEHMGWGQPGAFNHVVHYVYAACNVNSSCDTGNGDPGNVYYIRSTDSGTTFSAPLRLNSNTDPTKAQWRPNLSVSPSGSVFVTWYDEAPRTSSSCQPSSPTNLCYQIQARKSYDNGQTWLPDDTLSDVPCPLPLQPDSSVHGTYVGDYDYALAIATNHRSAWVDGRVIISGNSQQDVFTDREPVSTPVPTATFTPMPTASATATATPMATSTPTATATPNTTATATATPTTAPSATPTATPTPTARVTPTARPNVTPRTRPTPPPRL